MKTTRTTALFAALLTCTAVHAQNTPKDPYKDSPETTAPQATGESPPVNLSIRYEAFSLSLADAATLQRENHGDSELYARLVAMLAKKNARQETLTVLRTQSGQQATTESISEQIYPTEYETPDLPEAVGASFVQRQAPQPKPADGSAPEKPPVSVPNAAALAGAPSPNELSGLATPATPTSFETRNVGDTLEAEATVSADTQTIQVRLRPDRVTRSGTSIAGQGLSRTEMPEFESQRLHTSANVQIGKPFLLGTTNPPPVSKVDADSANRVWFAFVTADVAKP